MSTTTNSHARLREPSLAEMIPIQTEKINAKLGRDSLNAARHIERINIAASYVSQFLGGQRLRNIPVSEVTRLNCDDVAENIASDAGQEAIAGAARTLRNLVKHAREFLQEMDSVAWETPSPPTRDLPNFIRCNLTEKPLPLAADFVSPIHGRINLDLTFQHASIVSEAESSK